MRLDKILSIAIITLGIFTAFNVFGSSPFNIEFPIAELGNCANKTDCKIYCEKTENKSACNEFSRKHGLSIKSEEPSENRFNKFLTSIESDGGPDGICGKAKDPIKECEKVCSLKDNIKICLNYAITHNLLDGHRLEESKKVLNALENGISLPLGCNDEKSCKEVCENPKEISQMRECFKFAKAAGLAPENITEESAEKIFKVIESGKTPFKSPRDFEKCEAPPDDATLEACIQFGVENGFVSEKEAKIIKKTGGKGPGGCRGKECETYCNSPEHEEECFRFAEEHGLISEEHKQTMREGMQKFNEGLNNAPLEVVQCLNETVGTEVLEQIKNGTKLPQRDLGEKMRACFDAFFSSRDTNANKSLPGSIQVTPEIEECLKAKGLNPQNKEIPPRPEFELQMRACFESVFGKNPSDFPENNRLPENFIYKPQIDGNIAECFKRLNIDPRTLEGRPGPEIEQKIGNCMQEMQNRRQIEFNENPQNLPYPPKLPIGIENLSPEELEKYRSQFQDELNRQYQDQYQNQFNQRLQENLPPGTAPTYPFPYPNQDLNNPQPYLTPPLPVTPIQQTTPQSRFNPPTFLSFFAKILGIR